MRRRTLTACIHVTPSAGSTSLAAAGISEAAERDCGRDVFEEADALGSLEGNASAGRAARAT